MGKWDQRKEGGKASAGYQAKSHKGVFGSVLPGISGNSVVTSQSCLNQAQYLNFCMCPSLVKGYPSTSDTTHTGKMVWQIEENPVTMIQVLGIGRERVSEVGVPK